MKQAPVFKLETLIFFGFLYGILGSLIGIGFTVSHTWGIAGLFGILLLTLVIVNLKPRKAQ